MCAENVLQQKKTIPISLEKIPFIKFQTPLAFFRISNFTWDCLPSAYSVSEIIDRCSSSLCICVLMITEYVDTL